MTCKSSVLLLLSLLSLLFAQYSRETDSLALVAIGNVDNFSRNWDAALPLDEWDDVRLTDGRVTYLNLKDEYIGTLAPEIGHLTMLETLVLEGNKLGPNYNGTLPDAMQSLTNLSILNVNENLLYEIPAWIGTYTKLTMFFAEINRLSTLPDEIVNCTNLERLDLYNSGIGSLPDEIGKLQKVTQIDVTHCGLKTVPESIGLLENLETLTLKENQITHLPDAIGDLQNLTSLSLENNKLTALPATISNLASLKTLNIKMNEIVALPETIGDLTELEYLYANTNLIRKIPASVVEMTKLKSLELNENLISALPEGLGTLSTKISCIDNNLQFDALEFILGCSNTWYYQRQNKVPIIISNDSTKLYVDVKGSQNSYIWMEDWDTLDVVGDTISIDKSVLDSISYQCHVINDSVTNVTIRSNGTILTEDEYNTPVQQVINHTGEKLMVSLLGNDIHFSNPKRLKTDIALYTLSGKRLISVVTSGQSVSLPEIASGFYLLEIQNSLSYSVSKLMQY